MPSPGPLREKPRGTLEPVGARRLPWSPLQPPGAGSPPLDPPGCLPAPPHDLGCPHSQGASREGWPCALRPRGSGPGSILPGPGTQQIQVGRSHCPGAATCLPGIGLWACSPARPANGVVVPGSVCVCVGGVGSRKGSAAGRCVNTNQQDRAPRPLGGLQPPTRVPTPHRVRP